MCFGEGIVHTVSNNGQNLSQLSLVKVKCQLSDYIWSSARGLNCSLQWGNERNPLAVLYLSQQTAQHYFPEHRFGKIVLGGRRG